MNERKIIWQSSVKGIVNGIWVYTLAGIAGSVVSSIGDLTSGIGITSIMQMLMDGDLGDLHLGDLLGAGPSWSDIAGWLCTIAVVAGYFMFYSSVKRLIWVQANDSDRVSIDSIRSSYILLLVASLASLVPIIGGLVAFILLMVAYSKQLKAYQAIALSQAYSAQAKQGALLLRKCTQWILASVFIGWLPVIGGFAESLILLITFFKILQGWKMIGENECEDSESCEMTLPATAMTEKNYEYADAAAIKSDDELKAIINDGAAYDAAFVDIARNELMERTLGNRVQRTAEEVAAAKAERERLRLEHEARQQAEHEEQERQLQAEKEPVLPLGSHAKRYRTLFVVFFVLQCILSLVGDNLHSLNDWFLLDLSDEIFWNALNWIYFTSNALNVVAFGMLIPISSNRQIRTGVIVLVSMIGISALLSLVESISSDNTIFNICCRVYWFYLYPLAVIYAWSIVIRNNNWRRSEKSWTGMIVLLFCISILMSLPDSWEMNICVPGSYGQYYQMYGDRLERSIILYIWLLLDMIVCIKLAFSSAFTENLRESPLEKRQYFPFNKFVLAGVIAVVIRFAASAALAYYL